MAITFGQRRSSSFGHMPSQLPTTFSCPSPSLLQYAICAVHVAVHQHLFICRSPAACPSVRLSVCPLVCLRVSLSVHTSPRPAPLYIHTFHLSHCAAVSAWPQKFNCHTLCCTMHVRVSASVCECLSVCECEYVCKCEYECECRCQRDCECAKGHASSHSPTANRTAPPCPLTAPH